MLDTLWRDLRLACRGLSRAPGFAVAAVLTLAVGMTGLISMFALVEGVLLRPLPVRDQARLFVGWRALPEAGARHWPFKTTDLALLRNESRLLEGVAGVGYNDPGAVVVSEGGAAAYLRSARVTGEFFDVLGVQPLLGRRLTPRDDVSGAENVLVLAHGLWQRRHGGTRDVLGRRVLINEQPFTVVGVMPPDVDHPHQVEAWMTVAAMQTTTENPTWKNAMASELNLLARLRPGVTAAQAGAELRALAPQLDALRDPGDFRGTIPILQSFEEFAVGDVRLALLTLFGAVGLVLLIASANVANLLLVRGESRKSEFAVRAALGAGRRRLVRQLLTESSVLVLAASVVAVASTRLVLPLLLRVAPDGLPRLEAIHVDTGVVLFSVLLGLLVASLAGLTPAFASARLDLTSSLRDTSRGSTGSGTRRGRRVLIVAQVALAVTLVSAAGLLTRSLLRLQDVGVRLASDRLVYVPLALPATYADRDRQQRFITDLVSQLETIPAIEAATPINVVPFTGIGWDVPTFTAEGQAAERARTNPTLNLEEIHPNYFDTFEVALVRGRAFTEFDREGTTLVAIVSDDAARRTWPGEDPIGKRLKMGPPDSPDPWRTVVGVTAPTRYRELREPRATLYLPAAQMLGAARDVVLRTSAPLSLVTQLVASRVRALDPAVQVMPPRPFSDLLDEPLARPRFNSALIAVFGAAGLGLAALGLYAAMAASVRQRRREIGVRIAVGATARDVRRLVLGEGARLVGLGAMVGLTLALVTTRALRGLLYEVQPLDPIALASAMGLLMVVAGIALYIPTRQAGRVDPVTMLRAE
ncbi:MAG TPA: ABC transporter permease [Vicinamibacterales bacterium]|nr:ABC transporter permease [Vicinamibacterales bacterium]